MFQLLHTVANLALPASRCRLKLAVRGGILRVTGEELHLGMGFLGSRNVRRVPLAAICAVAVEPGAVPTDGVQLRIVTADDALTIAGVSPLSAQRLQTMLRTLAVPAAT